MLQIGKINKLKIKSIQRSGVYLDAAGDVELFLPKKSVPNGNREGDELEVFVYVEKENRLQCSIQRPIGWLTVA
jgi:predicted RNA-binding protein (virulence factor B family)